MTHRDEKPPWPLNANPSDARGGRRSGPEVFDGFTLRERQVLKRVARGMTYAAIGDELGISSRTVEVHAGSVKAKLPGLAHLPPRAAILHWWHQNVA